MSERQTDPYRVVIGAAETQTRTIDLTAALESGDVPSLPVVTLYRVVKGVEETYPAGLNGNPALTGPPYRISQSFTALVAGATYKVYWKWTVATRSPAAVYQHMSEIFCE